MGEDKQESMAESRIAVVGIIVERLEAAGLVNEIQIGRAHV